MSFRSTLPESPTDQPVVLAWMPAASYFRDPDGNLLELLSCCPMHPDPNWESLIGATGCGVVDPNKVSGV